MTGEWITNIPDVFNTTLLREKKQKEVEKKTIIQKTPKEGVDKLTKITPQLIESPSKKVVPKTNILNPDFPGSDIKIDDVKKEESKKDYLTEEEIRVLVQDEIEKILEDKHFIRKTKKGKRKPREGVYQRYYSGQITKKQFVKIVDGRSPVELLEINIISQQEYDEAIANPLSSLEYMQLFGPSITLKRKPEYLIIPGIATYVFLYIILAG